MLGSDRLLDNIGHRARAEMCSIGAPGNVGHRCNAYVYPAVPLVQHSCIELVPGEREHCQYPGESTLLIF